MSKEEFSRGEIVKGFADEITKTQEHMESSYEAGDDFVTGYSSHIVYLYEMAEKRFGISSSEIEKEFRRER